MDETLKEEEKPKELNEKKGKIEFKVPISKKIIKVNDEKLKKTQINKLKITKKKKSKVIVAKKAKPDLDEKLDNKIEGKELKTQGKKKFNKVSQKYFHSMIKSKINRGFLNNKLSCFMNATLQCLLNCPEFFEFLESLATNKTRPLKEEHPTCDALILLFKFFRNNLLEGNEFKAVDGESIFIDFYQRFNPNNKQQDAQEFLTYLLNQIDYEITFKDLVCQKNILMLSRTISYHPLTGESPLSKIFAGFLKSTIKPKDKEIVESSNEPFFILNFNLLNCNSLQAAIKKYFSCEQIDEYHHEVSGIITSAEKKNWLIIPPKILIINLQQCEFNSQENKFYKIQNKITFDLTITLDKEILGKDILVKYELISFIIHSGSSYRKGHYTCVCKEEKSKWYHYDDNKFVEIPEKSVTSYQPYILFLRKLS